MASSYSTDLKLELMVTGENAGTWGDITNTNLNILQQAIAGYSSITLNATTGDFKVMELLLNLAVPFAGLLTAKPVD